MRLFLLSIMCTTSALAAPPLNFNYTLLHSFGAAGDPGLPSSLTQGGGKLYGTTLSNTVFAYAPGGGEAVACTAPQSLSSIQGVTPLGGKLFGVAQHGGAHGYGGAFVCKPGGAFRELHDFGKGADGLYPSSPLLAVNKMLYGVTALGGTGAGTLYALTPHGKESVVYDFGKISPNPAGALAAVNGTLYGTGIQDVWSYAGGGTVSETCKLKSGYNLSGLVSHAGTLYGAASNGGTNGAGTLFTVTPGTGCNELVSLPAGVSFVTGTVALKGDSIYGVSYQGGGSGKGFIFRYGHGGHFQIVHAFTGTPDGEMPLSGLVRLGNTIYGTTYGGGTNGQGTIFAFTPPPG